uniref:Putative secreted protein n=1 Tax=Anopheles darlingi TaxID=43151 RepID=A0A2M4DLA1_ANODA
MLLVYVCFALILVWLVIASFLWLIPVTLGIGRPQRKVVSQQLHDECRIFIGILVQCVQLSNRIIECLFSQLAGFVGRI